MTDTIPTLHEGLTTEDDELESVALDFAKEVLMVFHPNLPDMKHRVASALVRAALQIALEADVREYAYFAARVGMTFVNEKKASEKWTL